MAKRVQWLSGYLSEGAAATASTTATGYDAANAVLLVRTSLWVATGATSQWLKFDLGLAKSITGVGLAGSNLSKWTGGSAPTLQRSSDGSSWTDVVTLDATLVGTDQDYFHVFGALSYQYWRVNVPNATEPPFIGVFYLGTATELNSNPKIGFEEADVPNVEIARAASGATVAEKFGRTIHRVGFEWENDPRANRDQIRSLLSAEGQTLRPFFYCPRDDAGSGAKGRGYFVRMVDGSYESAESFNNIFDHSVTLLEEV